MSPRSPLPAFITVSDKLTMTIVSENIIDVGVYVIQVKGTVVENPDATIITYLSKTSFFNIDMLNGCLEDIIEPVTYGIAKNSQYIIGTDTTEDIIFEWVQEREGCPMELAFVMVDSISQQERSMTN